MNKEAADKTTQSSSGKDPLIVGRLALDFLDTTWRIAVPVIIFAGFGLWADKSLGSAPWLTLLGTLIGFVFAALLVKKQLKGVNGGGNK